MSTVEAPKTPERVPPSVDSTAEGAGAGAGGRSQHGQDTPTAHSAVTHAGAGGSRRAPLMIGTDFRFDKELFSIPPHYRDSVDYLLVPHGMVLDRVQRLAQDIRDDYGSSVPHLICILKGGHAFFELLTSAMRTGHLFSQSKSLPFTFDFARLKSYEGTGSTGVVSIGLQGIDQSSVEGRDVLLVEDIVDTGLSMSKLIPALSKFKPKSVKVCTLLEKRTARSCGFQAHYVGFSVPDVFVIGCGMDYNEAFREMPHICVINDRGIEKYREFETEFSSL